MQYSDSDHVWNHKLYRLFRFRFKKSFIWKMLIAFKLVNYVHLNFFSKLMPNIMLLAQKQDQKVIKMCELLY